MACTTEALAEPDEAPRGGGFFSRPRFAAGPAPAADDGGQGQALFMLFTVAVLLVTGAVGLLALLTSWWVLGVVFGVHVLATVIVGRAIFAVFGSGNDGGGRAQPRSPAESGQASPVAA
jgi:hypothetical protein